MKKIFLFNRSYIFYLGILFIILSLVLNKVSLAYLFSPGDKKILNKTYLLIILLVRLDFFISGIYLIWNSQRAALKKVMTTQIACLLCLVLIVGIDLFISYYRLAMGAPLSKDPLIVIDQKLGWRLKDNIKILYSEGKLLLETDDEGWRKINSIADNASVAIYFFGDSFTFGSGVSNDAVFPYIIANEYLNGKVQVYNTAVMGYGIPQMYQAFLEIEDRIKPQDIIIFCPISHDISRTYQDFTFLATFVLFGGKKIPAFPIFENSTLRTKSMESFYSVHNRLKIICLCSPIFGNIYAKLFKNHPYNHTRDAQEMFEQIKYKTESRGAKFIIFFLPCLDEKKNRKYKVDVSGIDHVDLMNDFPDEKNQLETLYDLKNGHYSHRGHRFVAKILMKYLIDKKVLVREFLAE